MSTEGVLRLKEVDGEGKKTKEEVRASFQNNKKYMGVKGRLMMRPAVLY